MMTRWLIERAGVQITVRAKSQAAQQLVEVAIMGMRPVQVSKAHGISLTVDGHRDEWHLYDHSSKVARKITTAGDLIYHLTDRIVFHFADKVTDKHCLHAASVSINGNAIVIPAGSGSGKSSFTTWLVANGFDYITDELILIDEDKKIEGLARPIQIKAHGRSSIEHLISRHDGVFPGKLINAVSADCLGGKVSPLQEHKLSLLVFPQFSKAAEFSFTQLSSADAGMRLMVNHVNARNLEGHGFRVMMKTIRETPCYALDYGGFDALPRDFSERLTQCLLVE